MNRIVKHSIWMALGMALTIPACKKTSGDGVDNPYKNVQTGGPKDTGNTNKNASPSSIEGLHRDLFKPTCSNSGCHDGTFEPDFRTVQSTWATLVHAKPIKNDSAGTFAARVVPGNADASILMYRMTVDLGGNSGIMPIVLDPGSDYPQKKSTHLENVRKWINDGAKDFNGNPPQAVDYPPQILGVAAFSGASQLPRGGRYEPIYASAGGNIELWFSLSDDKVAQNSLTGMKINWSTDPSVYNPANEKSLSLGMSRVLPGLYSSSTTYNWYYTFDASGLKSGDVIWFRITCNDGVNANYQLPNDNSMFFLKKYFAVRIN